MLLSLIQNSKNGTEAKSDEYSRAGKRRVIQKKKKRDKHQKQVTQVKKEMKIFAEAEPRPAL